MREQRVGGFCLGKVLPPVLKPRGLADGDAFGQRVPLFAVFQELIETVGAGNHEHASGTVWDAGCFVLARESRRLNLDGPKTPNDAAHGCLICENLERRIGHQ